MQVLEEWTASGGTTNLSRVYNFGYSLISQRQPGVSTNYFVFDGHGSTRVLADIGGNVVNAFAFDAWGNLIASNTAPQTAYLYGGQQFDTDLNQYYLRKRLFNPGTGRFFTADKKGGDPEDPRSLHRYIFGADDPVGNVDPDGESFIAFDGTGNYPGEKDGGVEADSNVYKMYYGSTDPDHHYEIGVGTGIPGLSFPGQAFGAGMARRERKAMRELREDRKHGDTVVDIIGFSRGGIEATEFANRVADTFGSDERIRFVGLFDPVGSVGHPGGMGSYRFQLPPNVENSAEAIALDERRSWFPGTDVNAKVQQPFRGTHSDVGGGWANHQLSDFALQWMIQQAQGAHVGIDLDRIKTRFGWDPNENGQVNPNRGITSWFNTKGSRTMIGDDGTFTLDSLGF